MRPVAAAAALLLVGCGTIQSTPQHNYTPQVEAVTRPAPGQVHEATVGEEILRSERHTVRDMIYVPSVQVVSMYRIAPGYFKKVGDSPDGDYFQPAGGPDAGSISQIGIADPPQALIVKRDSRHLCVITVYNFLGCERPQAQVTRASAEGYELRRMLDVGGSFQALTYSGRDGSKIVLTHFASGGSPSARVEHDLSTSTVMLYRGARIEVMEADAKSIKYRVLQGF